MLVAWLQRDEKGKLDKNLKVEALHPSQAHDLLTWKNPFKDPFD